MRFNCIIYRLMNLTGRGKLYLAIGALSLIFSYLIVTLNFFPHLGLAVAFLIFLLFSFKYKENKQSDTKLYLVFGLLFSIFIFVRSEPLITFLNLTAVVFFGLLILLPAQVKSLGFTDYFFSPFLFLFKSVFTRSNYYLEYKKQPEHFGRVNIVEIIFGVLITLLLMAVILPLLSSANPFFQKIVLDLWNFLKLDNLLRLIGLENLFIWLLRAAFFFSFLFMIPKVMTLANKAGRYTLPLPFKKEDFPLLIPKLILAIILVVFFITQLQFYFATDESLRNLGLTHSQHTREVFTQLSLVAGVVMLLIYNSGQKSGLGRTLIWILGVQGIFLTLMAYKSDFEYINAWGLTYKRLYGLSFATWISGIFVLFFVNLRQKREAVAFVKKTIIFSGVMLLTLNILNFDYLIYHFQKARTGQGIDYTYLSTLSADSLSYKQQILKLEEVAAKGDYSLDEYNNKNPLFIIHKIESLQNKYSKFDFRTFGLLDFIQYQQIKSQDTKQLRARFENKLLFYQSGVK